MTIHDAARYLVPGGNPRAVIVPARIARALARLLHDHHGGLCEVWAAADPEAGAVLAALDRAGVEWTQASSQALKEISSPSGTWEVPPHPYPPESMRDELDTATVARRLHCTPRNVRGLHDRGRLTGRKVGGRLVFAPEEVAALAAQRED